MRGSNSRKAATRSPSEKTRLPAARIYDADGTVDSRLAVDQAIRTSRVQVLAAASPFGYTQYVLQATMSQTDVRGGLPPASLYPQFADVLPLVGLDIEIGCTFRRTTGNNPLCLYATFSSATPPAWTLVANGEIDAYKQPANDTTGWQTVSGKILASAFPAGADWVRPMLRAGEDPNSPLSNGLATTHQVAAFTMKYVL